MKKILLILLLTAAPVVALETHGQFQAGRSVEDSTAFTYLQIEIVQSIVTLYGGIRTWFWLDLPAARPFRNIYDIGARLSIGSLFLDLNHFCNHPVWSEMERYEWYSQKWGETITTISVGVRW